LRQALVAVALLAACRGGHPSVRDAGRPRPASAVSAPPSLVPKIGQSPDPIEAMRELDQRIAIHRKPGDEGQEIGFLLDRAAIRGDLEDYAEALALSGAWIEHAPKSDAAWKARVGVLTRVHRFGAARDALDHLEPLVPDRSEWEGLAATIDEATGQLDRSAPYREATARRWPSTVNLVQWANSLALQGKLDDALAVMPKAAAVMRENPPELFEYLYFQWGRLYEQKGEPAAARQFYEAALARLPTVEVQAHLAQALIATGDRDAARKVVTAALAGNRHPDLVALAAELEPDPGKRAALVAEAKAGWERYLAALPDAFADHAARFFVGVGGDPARALALADQNLANRDTLEARALVVEAALAAGAPDRACAVAGPIAEPRALRAQRFLAWRALTACHRTDQAARLGAELGIAPP